MTGFRALVRGWMIGWLTKEGEPHEVPLCDFKRLSEELQPGDVVLVEGRTRVGGIIKLITQTAWTHAALYLGRLHDIEDRALRNLVVQHYQRDHSEQLLLEALIGEGTRISPLSCYANDHLRICRPHGLSRGDAQRVIGYAIRRLGSGYDVRQLLAQFRRVMPAMSRTEQEALEAGGTWWDAELFSGPPEWSRLRNLPPARLSPAEQAFLDGPVEQLCRMLDDWRITHEDLDLPPEVWSFIRRERLFGLVIPTRYGGLGFSPLAHSEIVMKLASRSITAAVTLMVPNSLGPAELLLRYGTQAQRDRWLPRLASGDAIPCFALTGPKAGSDSASTPDIGVVCRGVFKGRPTLGIRIDFDNGPTLLRDAVAARLITQEDATAVREAEQLRDAVIGVDSFAALRPRQSDIRDESRAAA